MKLGLVLNQSIRIILTGDLGEENVPMASVYVLAASLNCPADSRAFALLINGCKPGGSKETFPAAGSASAKLARKNRTA